MTTTNDPGQCYATGVALGTPVTWDNCGVASVFNNAPAQFPVGTTLVTWTVRDTEGFTATCVQVKPASENLHQVSPERVSCYYFRTGFAFADSQWPKRSLGTLAFSG
ncbi:MAG: HYR domain-containing protein [Verrucomicrobiae bacterium]|nr:HYR domain-containing protein [Verrucomicrobiae bacterium]